MNVVFLPRYPKRLGVGASLEVKGRNGSGKTTLLRALIGLHRQTRGSFSISTSFLYQGHKLGLDESMTPVENLVWFQALNGRKANQSSAFRNIDFLGLSELIHPVSSYPRVRKKRFR